MNYCVEEVYESEQVRTSKKLLRTILYNKYEKADLNKLMKNQCQPLQKHNVMSYQICYKSSKICFME